MEGIKERNGLEKFSTPFKNVVDQLVTTPPQEVIDSARSFRISDTIDVQNLRKLAELPYEFTITRGEEGLLLTTGSEYLAAHEWDETTPARMAMAHATLHNHPPALGEGRNTPSIGDIRFLLSPEFKKVPARNIIIYGDGVVAFGFEGSPPPMDSYDEILKKYGLNESDTEEDIERDQDKVRLFYKAWAELADNMGIILGRASWNEPEKVQKLLE